MSRRKIGVKGMEGGQLYVAHLEELAALGGGCMSLGSRELALMDSQW